MLRENTIKDKSLHNPLFVLNVKLKIHRIKMRRRRVGEAGKVFHIFQLPL
jgi:hypothetical protein